MKKKTLFVFNIQGFSDIITNSSSELFIFNNGKTKDEVASLLDKVTPGWKDEYTYPQTFAECDNQDKTTIIDYCFDMPRVYDIPYSIRNTEKKIAFFTNLYLTFAKKYDIKLPIEKFYSDYKYIKNIGNYDVPWEERFGTVSYEGCKVLEEVFNKVFDKCIFLFSRYDNPDWDRQKNIEQYADRHHLG